MDDTFDVKKLYDLQNYIKPKTAIEQDIDDANKRKEFLDTIAMIESSGGKNFDHPTIESGIHEGQQASGKYGLMPNTVKEVINRKLRSGRGKDLKPLLKEDPEQIKAKVESDPSLENRIADSLAQRVLASQDNDEEKAAYSWLYGHNMSPEDIEKRNYKEDDYVKKYNRYKNVINSLKKDK